MALLAIIASAILAVAAGAAVRAGDRVVVQEAVSENLYLAGGEVETQADVRGDLVAAGGRVSVQQRVQGDVAAAGAEVTILGEVQDDVRAAGGDVALHGRIGGDAVAAGGRVALAPGARVGGSAWLAGGSVDVAGHIAHRLRAAGKAVRISGQVDGNVDVAALSLEILPGARIAGSLSYRSPEAARIDPAAQIGGPITHRPSTTADRLGRLARMVFWILGLMFLLALVVAGVVLLLLFPDVMGGAARTIATDPGKSLVLGLVLLLATPLFIGVLMVTILGIPLGLWVIALYVLWLLVGFLTAAVFLGDLGVRLTRREPSRGWRLFFFLIALIVLGLVQGIPMLGGLLLFLALVIGAGAWSLHLARRYRGVEAAA